VIKTLASFMLSLCFCVPGLAEKNVSSVDSSAIEQEIRNAVRKLETQLPELLRAIRINVQIPDIDVHIPEIQVPEIQIPEIHVQVPTDVQIPKIQLPEIHIPEIRVKVPRIDIQIPKLPE
jgi:hypothetical protein